MENQYKKKFLNAANKVNEKYNYFSTTEDNDLPDADKYDKEKYATIVVQGGRYFYNKKIVSDTITSFGRKKYINGKLKELKIFCLTQSIFNHYDAINCINGFKPINNNVEERALVLNKKVYDSLSINEIALAYDNYLKIFFQ